MTAFRGVKMLSVKHAVAACLVLVLVVLVAVIAILFGLNLVKSAEEQKEPPSPVQRWITLGERTNGSTAETVPQSQRTNSRKKDHVAARPTKIQTPSSTEAGCEVCVDELPGRHPLFLKGGEQGGLMRPTNGYLKWAPGESSEVICTSGRDSSIKFTGNNVDRMEIECIGGRIFKMDNKEVDITSVTCTNKVIGAPNGPFKDPECPATWLTIDIADYNLFGSCFNESDSSVLFTRHTLYGSDITYAAVTNESNPSFTTDKFPRNASISTAYTRKNQMEKLRALFSQSEQEFQDEDSVMNYYNKNYLERAFLIPKADQIFPSEQWSTFYYINVVGMWRSINQGNWKVLNEKIRGLAEEKSLKLTVYTGTYGTLQPCTKAGFCPPFTLRNGSVPVPKWIWKTVVAPDRNEAISFVVSNNPVDDEKPLCTGPDYGWLKHIAGGKWPGKISVCSAKKLKQITGLPQRDMIAFEILEPIVFSML